MKAYIKKERFEEFKNRAEEFGYKFLPDHKNNFVKTIDVNGLWIRIRGRTREIKLLTPMGGSPFMEVHKDKYQELIDNDMVEFVKGRFD